MEKTGNGNEHMSTINFVQAEMMKLRSQAYVQWKNGKWK